jgi:lipopolysaccharide heptosyltransferase II
VNAARLPLRGPIRRILVLRPRALGDVLLCTPALRALRGAFPDAELHAGIDDVLAPVLCRNPHLDRLWLLPRRAPRRRDWLRVYRDLRQVRFDLVLDLHGSARTASLAWWSGAPNRVGFALRGRGRLYNFRLPRDADRQGRRRMLYAAQTNLEIVARLASDGTGFTDARLEFPPLPAAEMAMQALLDARAPQRPRVGLSPAGTWPAKTWPVASWAQLGDRIAAQGATVLLLWGPGEQPVVEAVQAAMQSRAVILPRTDLDAMAAIVGRLDLLVCNDSGIKHVAVARGTPTLTLYGPTHPLAWSPPAGPHTGLRVELPCIACNRTHCLHATCMRGLDPAAVAAHVTARLATAAREPACGS